MGGLKRILKSSKVQIAIVGILAMAGTQYLGMDAAAADKLSLQIMAVVIALIGGIAYEDSSAKKNGNGGEK